MKIAILRSMGLPACLKASIYFTFYQTVERQRYSVWLQKSPSCRLWEVHTREVYI